MQLLAKFKKILYMGFRATLNFEVLKELQQLKEKHGGKERGRARGKRSTAIKVPSSCRVSSLNGNILAHLFRLPDLAYHFSFYANAIFVICLPLLVKQNISM